MVHRNAGVDPRFRVVEAPLDPRFALVWDEFTRKLGDRPGNGAPLRARAASFFLPCERGLNNHTDVITRPHLSLAL